MTLALSEGGKQLGREDAQVASMCLPLPARMQWQPGAPCGRPQSRGLKGPASPEGLQGTQQRVQLTLQDLCVPAASRTSSR